MNKKIFLVVFFSLLVAFGGCSTRGKGTYTYKRYGASGSSHLSLSAHASYKHPTMRPYVVHGVRYYPTVVSVGDKFEGIASWYGPNFHGKLTSNGERYNMWAMTAAHKTLPMNTIVRVTNKRNGKSVVVRINDRGPFVNNRIIDLSKSAANKLDMIATGTAPVQLEVLGFANKKVRKVPQSSKALKVELQHSPKSMQMGNFALQIGSFSKIEGAMRTQEKYDGTDGYKTVIKDVETFDGRMFKVVLTGFKSEKEARDYKAKGKFPHAFILKED